MATEKTHITVCGLCAAEGTVVLRTQDNDGNYKALPTYRLECTACDDHTAWWDTKAEAQDEWSRMLGGGMGGYTAQQEKWIAEEAAKRDKAAVDKVLEAEARAREAHRDAVLGDALVKQRERAEEDYPETTYCPKCDKYDVVKLTRGDRKGLDEFHYGCSKCGLWSETCLKPHVAYRAWLAKADAYRTQHDEPVTTSELRGLRDKARAVLEAEIDHPPHYTQLRSIEPIDVIEGLNLPYHLGCVLKYIWRWDAKDQPLKNLKKAQWYLDRYITELECSRDD